MGVRWRYDAFPVDITLLQRTKEYKSFDNNGEKKTTHLSSLGSSGEDFALEEVTK